MVNFYSHSSQPVLQAQDISKSFLTGSLTVPVLRHLSLTVNPGELTLISGPSGCGKSTLLSLLSGLQQPDSGKAIALGIDLSTFSRAAMERFRLEHTGFIFQGFNLFPSLTAIEQVQLPMGYLGVSKRTSEERAMAALEDVGLSHRAHMYPAQLSGGGEATGSNCARSSKSTEAVICR